MTFLWNVHSIRSSSQKIDFQFQTIDNFYDNLKLNSPVGVNGVALFSILPPLLLLLLLLPSIEADDELLLLCGLRGGNVLPCESTILFRCGLMNVETLFLTVHSPVRLI